MKKNFIIILMFVSVSSFGQEIESMLDSLKFYYQETDKYYTMLKDCESNIPIDDIPLVYSEEIYDNYYDTYGYKVAKSYKNYYEYEKHYFQSVSEKDSLETVLKTIIVENIKESKLVSEKRCVVKNYENVIEEFCDVVGYEYVIGACLNKDLCEQYGFILNLITKISRLSCHYFSFL